MPPDRWRKLILAALAAALIAGAGIARWSPKALLAAPRNQADRGSSAENNRKLGDWDLAEELPASSPPPISPKADLLATRLPDQGAPTGGHWPADPFFRPAPASGKKAGQEQVQPVAGDHASYHLTAILGGVNPLAILDGQVVGLGDRLAGGAYVAAIEELSVILETPTGKVVVKLPE